MDRQTSLILINPSPASEPARQLQEQIRRAVATLVPMGSVEEALSHFSRPGSGAAPLPEAVVIGPDVVRPLVEARRLHGIHPSLHVVFVAHPEREAELRRELAYGMPAGTQWSLARADDPRVAAVVRDALQTAHQRRQFRTTLDRINVQLSARSAPDAADLRRLMVSDHYLANILNHAHDAIISLDLRSTVVSWNQGAEKLFGVSSRDAVGRTLKELAGWPVEFRDALARSVSGELVRQEFRLKLAQGPADVDLTLSPVRDNANVIIAIAAIIRDVTERKRVEVERASLLEAERAARAEAERASRLKDEFLATLSHELRTPLNAILGWSQILERADSDPATNREGLAAIARNARIQTQLIEDLLDMSRIASGKISLDVQQVFPAEVVEAAIESVTPLVKAKHLRLEKVLATGVGPIMGDRARLQQVCWNLLTNAAKFTPKGGKIQVVVAQVGSSIEISVSDTGEGIRANFLPHIFERFRQADASSTRRHGGLGLGLALVKQLVELHGGTVAARSRGEGQGSTFTVTLPVAIVAEHGMNSAVRTGQDLTIPDSDLDISGLKVLVVDDERDAQAIVRRILEHRNAQVITAGSAKEGFELLKRQRPDVLISDIGMPQHDGYELIRWVRSLPPDEGGRTAAAAVTAFARSQDRTQALRAGYQAHVAKPVAPQELVTVIASLAGRTGPHPA